MLPQQPARHAGLIERSMPKEGTAMEAQMTVNATRNGLDMDLLQGIVGELREHPGDRHRYCPHPAPLG
jgi:hypothetical protein